MKKLVLSAVLVFLLLGAVGCSRADLKIDSKDITVDTILAKKNGELRVATVEEFNKSYYDLSELQNFVKQQVDLYNKKIGEEKVTVDAIEQKEGKAIMLLTYSGMDQYASFNEVSAAYFNGGIGEVALDLPTTLIDAKNNSLASTKEIIQNEKYRVLVMFEPYDIVVQGKVKYYSENSELLDDNKVRGAAEGMTVVVFK